MKLEKFTAVVKLEHRFNISLLVNLLLSFVVIVLSMANISAYKRERIVIVPPGLSGPTTVGWSRADEAYVKNYAMYFTLAFVEINPKNVGELADALTTFIDPKIYTEMRAMVLAKAKNPVFNSASASVQFVPTMPPIYEAETETVFLQGNEVVSTGFGKTDPKAVIYEVRVRMVEGKPLIYGFSSYYGTIPHTSEWKKLHKDDPNNAKA